MPTSDASYAVPLPLTLNQTRPSVVSNRMVVDQTRIWGLFPLARQPDAMRRQLRLNPGVRFAEEGAAGPQRDRVLIILRHLSRSCFRVARSLRIAAASAS